MGGEVPRQHAGADARFNREPTAFPGWNRRARLPRM